LIKDGTRSIRTKDDVNVIIKKVITYFFTKFKDYDVGLEKSINSCYQQHLEEFAAVAVASLGDRLPFVLLGEDIEPLIRDRVLWSK